MLPIKGWQKTSLIDYPDKICSTIFLEGCNFRCGFCHNKDLVVGELVNKERLPLIHANEILAHLKKHKKLIDGICITGGEPTLHKELPGLIKKIKKLGFLVKLDTNGTNPKMVKRLIDKKLIDYIAMDMKTSFENYEKAANNKVNIENIKKSIDIIRESNVDYEFRTTLVPGLVLKEDILEICAYLKGSRKYCLQQFVPKNTLDLNFEKVKPYSLDELKQFKCLAEPYFRKIELRD